MSSITSSDPTTPSSAPSILEQTRHNLAKPAVAAFVGGGVAGGVSRTLVSPLERLKILYQVQDKGKTEYKMSIRLALRKIWNEEGVRGLMRGNGSNCVRIIPYSAIQFMAYTQLKALLVPRNESWQPAATATAGALAGITSVTCTYPLDIVRTRLSIQSASFSSLSESQKQKLPGMWASLVSMYKTEGGVRALYRGIIPTIAGVAPYIGASWATYEALRKFFTKPGEEGPTGLRKLIAGAMAGAVAQTCTYPADVMRRRFQINTMKGMGYQYASMGDAVRQIYRTEGWRGFYKGLFPNLLKVAPAIGISYYSFETVKAWLQSLE